MIQCIVGAKGSGKTKQLIQMVNDAVKEVHGSVLCIERNPKLTYDINHACRLIDTVDYSISSYDAFYGFICGLYAQNYDISTIFIDSLYKIAGSSETEEVKSFMEKLDAFSKKTNVRFVITISAELDDVPELVKLYL